MSTGFPENTDWAVEKSKQLTSDILKIKSPSGESQNTQPLFVLYNKSLKQSHKIVIYIYIYLYIRMPFNNMNVKKQVCNKNLLKETI